MSDTKIDFKKEYKDLYLPKGTPSLIDVPPMTFIAIDGTGDPDHEPYKKAVEALYSLSYTIKMSPKAGMRIEGYREYVVPPLEGLWTTPEAILDPTDLGDRDEWIWTSMIRQPDFVDEKVFVWACEEVRRKKSEVDISGAYLFPFTEGLCVQIMHVGPYATEPESLLKMRGFMGENNLEDEVGPTKKHHEIYLSDPRRVKPESLKTVLRHPVKAKSV